MAATLYQGEQREAYLIVSDANGDGIDLTAYDEIFLCLTSVDRKSFNYSLVDNDRPLSIHSGNDSRLDFIIYADDTKTTPDGDFTFEIKCRKSDGLVDVAKGTLATIDRAETKNE